MSQSIPNEMRRQMHRDATRAASRARKQAVQTKTDMHFLVIVRHIGVDNLVEITPFVLAGPLKKMDVREEGINLEDTPFGSPVHWRVGTRSSIVICAQTFMWPREAVEQAFPQVDDFLHPEQSEVEVTLEAYGAATSLRDPSDVLYRGPTEIIKMSAASQPKLRQRNKNRSNSCRRLH